MGVLNYLCHDDGDADVMTISDLKCKLAVRTITLRSYVVQRQQICVHVSCIVVINNDRTYLIISDIVQHCVEFFQRCCKIQDKVLRSCDHFRIAFPPAKINDKN